MIARCWECISVERKARPTSVRTTNWRPKPPQQRLVAVPNETCFQWLRKKAAVPSCPVCQRNLKMLACGDCTMSSHIVFFCSFASRYMLGLCVLNCFVPLLKTLKCMTLIRHGSTVNKIIQPSVLDVVECEFYLRVLWCPLPMHLYFVCCPGRIG